jgi:hypothetical protein
LPDAKLNFNILALIYMAILVLFEGLKRSVIYRITDTPLHKQNYSRIATRQQKIIKRISFQKLSSTKMFIPDTPDKSKNSIFFNCMLNNKK